MAEPASDAAASKGDDDAPATPAPARPPAPSAPSTPSAAARPAEAAPRSAAASEGMLPPRPAPRPTLESAFMRFVATAGVVGIGVAIAGILGSQGTQAWIIGLVVSTLSVILAAVLWSSREL